MKKLFVLALIIVFFTAFISMFRPSIQTEPGGVASAARTIFWLSILYIIYLSDPDNIKGMINFFNANDLALGLLILTDICLVCKVCEAAL